MSASAAWTRRPERGAPALIGFMAWLSLRIGRAPARVFLHPISAYFLIFAGSAGRASREFLRRVLGRAPTWRERYRLFFNFASTLHDRVFFLSGRFDLFEFDVHGSELFGGGSGAFLIGAHLGSFESVRAAGRGRETAMAMYEDNARKVNAVLTMIAPRMRDDIVRLGRVGAMLNLRDRLDRGALVGMLADRTLGDEAAIDVDFLGGRAPFPTGPMRIAAALHKPVIFMVGLYRGANRYDIHFEPLADFSSSAALPREERERLIHDAVVRYANKLEHYARLCPDNWFNFHSFWGS